MQIKICWGYFLGDLKQINLKLLGYKYILLFLLTIFSCFFSISHSPHTFNFTRFYFHLLYFSHITHREYICALNFVISIIIVYN